MPRLDSFERREVDAVKEAAAESLAPDRLRKRLGDRLMRSLDGDSYCFLRIDPATSLPVDVVGSGPHDARTIRTYTRDVMGRSRAADIPALLATRRRVHRLEQLVRPSERATDPYVRELLSPFGLDRELLGVFGHGGRAFGKIAVSRRAGRAAFTDREVRLLDVLAPHVTAALRAAAARFAADATPGRGTGMMLVDARGEVELANGVAEELLATTDPAVCQSYFMAIEVARALLARCFEEGRPPSLPPIRFVHPVHQERYAIRVERVTDRKGRPMGLLMIEPVRASEDAAALEQLGLTPREAEVALALLRGQDSRGAAESLGMSPHTLGHHLRRVFEKVGVTSRRELAARLSGT